MAKTPPDMRSAAEKAFKAVTTKPVDLPPKSPAIPGAKETVSLRIDRDVLDFFQEDGPGWQDRINAALRKAAGKWGAAMIRIAVLSMAVLATAALAAEKKTYRYNCSGGAFTVSAVLDASGRWSKTEPVILQIDSEPLQTLVADPDAPDA